MRWSDGRFYFESLNPKAVPVVDPVSDVLEAMASAEVDQEEEAAAGALDDDYDARLRVYRQIVARRGQAGFRAALLAAYQGRCAVTGFDAAVALEGAHLRPYRGPESNDVTNGLLLRADIHTLLDLGLLAPDTATRTIVVSKLLTGTKYGAPVRLPSRRAGRSMATPEPGGLGGHLAALPRSRRRQVTRIYRLERLRTNPGPLISMG